MEGIPPLPQRHPSAAPPRLRRQALESASTDDRTPRFAPRERLVRLLLHRGRRVSAPPSLVPRPPGGRARDFALGDVPARGRGRTLRPRAPHLRGAPSLSVLLREKEDSDSET